MVQTRKSLAVGIVATFAVGCFSGEPLSEHQADGDADEDRVVHERYGALAAEVSSSALDEEGEVDVQAQFLDARGVDVEAALDALEVWAPRRGLERDECRVEPASGTTPEAQHRPVSLHLLGVGAIEVEGPADTVSLQPRRLPDLLSSFYGVVYGSEWDDEPVESSVDYRPGEPYHFRAPGAGKTGEFDVKLQAPQPVVLAAANGERIDGRDLVTVDGNQDLELVWETRGNEEGEVFIDVAVGTTLYGTRVQCRSDDDGAVTIPADDLARFDDGANLEIRRVQRTKTDVDGLEDVDVYFSTTDRIELRFE